MGGTYPTMTGPWQTLLALLREAEYHGYERGSGPTQKKLKTPAEYKKDLEKLLTQRYGEHRMQQAIADMRRLGSYGAWKQHMSMEFGSAEIDKIISDMGKAFQASDDTKRAQRAAASPSKGTVRGPSGREYSTVSEPERAQKQASVDAMRQLRQTAMSGERGTGSDVLTTPGKGGPSAMGTAGQNQPKDQPSVSQGYEPAISADKLKQMRVSQSGIVRAQREVDRKTKEEGERAGDELAQQLGVPTTKQRTVIDPDTGEKKVQIWGPDRVMKQMDVDKRDLPLQGPGKAASMQGADLKGAPTDTAKRAKAAARGASAAAGVQDPDRIAKIKAGVLSRNAAQKSGEGGPTRPGSHEFEVWQPHGQSGEVDTFRPDKATGNWTKFKREVGPENTGKKWIWYTDKGGTEPRWHTETEFEDDYPKKAKEITASGSKGLVHRAMARAGTVPMQGHDPEDDEYPEDQGWRKA